MSLVVLYVNDEQGEKLWALRHNVWEEFVAREGEMRSSVSSVNSMGEIRIHR